ncbi:hypothetical protein BDV27DRAFT_147772 [Aspergillus caelatus]|uniref:Aconitase/3-isopropylmalate dehydratase large subunit alpha/beta/alpha domain-containing protein n=1 Tax=Aspergillus caelatus TaxID=61420 RepID=A0A5N6ZV64_9EURO|nr:uncharacterized protein BDV27DRAFT_147772 [Aspergillus caelatus]KAE8361504.1 hypothetical protein BDV27DRAFT_147772 [Aspergillus caelatus]
MTVVGMIFAQHLVGTATPAELRAGTVVHVGLDCILLSELSWQEMARVYENDLRSPGIWRNDRFWLVADHVVYPAAAKISNMQDLIDRAEKGKSEFKIAEYQGLNYTIIYTEFVIGADSYMCSGGAVGCLAIGLGGIDVLMGLMLGETWFKIPESILMEFQGCPAPGIFATERIVEFGGEDTQFLSCDAHFMICNMATEFGAISGIFVSDKDTREFISKRKLKRYQRHSIYFRPDNDALYAGKYITDLSMVEPIIALYTSPDNVVALSKKSGMLLDGVFIGAYTTTEEQLVLAALVSKVGLKKGLQLVPGKCHYVPGSFRQARIHGCFRTLCQGRIYKRASGISYCLGLSVDPAGEGETWLSSQNRDFQNRMGNGLFGHLSSAVVCASSSFSMSPTITNLKSTQQSILVNIKDRLLQKIVGPGLLPVIKSHIVRLEDFVDTDALTPGPTLTSCVADEDFGKVQSGQQVVVAGHAFGCGSSREVAVSTLKDKLPSTDGLRNLKLGVGIEAVIARSFAFIFNKNMRTLGLLRFIISDNTFYKPFSDRDKIPIDIKSEIIVVKGKRFTFELSNIEKELIIRKGVVEGYKLLEANLWKQLTSANTLP